MAIAFDSNTAFSVNPASDTIAHTCTGADRYLVVGILIQSSQTCTGVTYGGVAMTEIVSVVSGVSAGETIYLFGLANPASGTNNIVATFSGAGTRAIGASSFTGAQQTSASEASNSATGTGTTATVNVTTLTDNAWLIGFARGEGNTTAGTGTVIRGAASNINLMDSNSAKTPAGADSLVFTLASGTWASLAFSLTPPASGPANLKSYNTNVKANIKSINTNPIANVKSLNTNV